LKGQVKININEYIFGDENSTLVDIIRKQLEVMIIGITLLNCFIQINWTGPKLSLQAENLIPSSYSNPYMANGKVFFFFF